MKCITGQPLTRLDIGKLRTAQATHSATDVVWQLCPVFVSVMLGMPAVVVEMVSPMPDPNLHSSLQTRLRPRAGPGHSKNCTVVNNMVASRSAQSSSYRGTKHFY